MWTYNFEQIDLVPKQSVSQPFKIHQFKQNAQNLEEREIIFRQIK